MPKSRVANDVQTAFRLPKELYDRLVEAAAGQPIGGEIRRRIEASLSSKPAMSDPWFDDVLTAINRAAAGAIELKRKPVLPPGIMERDGKQVPHNVERWGADTTAYAVFADAVRTLLNAFVPEQGMVAVSQETQLRLADQLVGLALGSLGESGFAAFANLSDIDRQSMKLSGGDAERYAEAAEQQMEDEQ